MKILGTVVLPIALDARSEDEGSLEYLILYEFALISSPLFSSSV